MTAADIALTLAAAVAVMVAGPLLAVAVDTAWRRWRR